jgi:carboxymethylenebutenolidase
METTMAATVDYYFTPVSPWTYLGHARFAQLLRDTGSAVRVRPVDYGAIFPVSGGLPLPKRAPQRQAYRLLELRRFSDWLGVPLHPQPAHFPVSADAASRLIIAVDQARGPMAALDVAGRLGAAVWAEQRNLADPATLAAVLDEAGLPADLLAQADAPAVAERMADDTRAAIDAGVFGAPSYVIDGEIFWGQDRLDFVARRLRADAMLDR